MSDVVDRFIKYCKVASQSNPLTADKVPSTECQFEIAEVIAADLRELGALDVKVSEHAYVTAHWPASAGCEDLPTLGFCCHIDTAWQSYGDPVHPEIKHYEGGKLTIGTGRDGREVWVSPETNRHLEHMVGWDLITTDGTSLLGGDDKAGVAEIMTAIERIQSERIPHGKLSIAFTPDEEIGEGADFFDVAAFGADYAYTMDGGPEGELEYENFNAAAAVFSIKGFSVHPGSAKDVMINALLVACQINSLLPACDTPRCTEEYEGFYHITRLGGTIEQAEIAYIVRDHSFACYEGRLATLRHIEKVLNEKYGAGTVRLTIREQYRNMKEQIVPCMHLIENAEAATREAGMEPKTVAIRGGTDGARLSYMGLPCPNLGTGGYAYHGPCEHITVEGMDLAADMLLRLVCRYAAQKRNA